MKATAKLQAASMAAIWCCLQWCRTEAFVFGRGSVATAPPTSSAIVAYGSIGNHHDRVSVERREVLEGALVAYLALPSLASASNLPDSTGADLSRTGSVDTLIPIVAMQRSLTNAKLQLTDPKDGGPVMPPSTFASMLQSLLKRIPREERAFKRVFDAYSTPVSYKQKFLDQNAFLVYYSKGFDGPGRANIEEDATGNVQTLQYGFRNDAWSALDDLFVELEYGQRSDANDASSSRGELVALMDKVLIALDSYLSLAPDVDVAEASRRLGQI